MTSQQDPVAESVASLADQIDVLVTAPQAPLTRSQPPQMTAEGVMS